MSGRRRGPTPSGTKPAPSCSWRRSTSTGRFSFTPRGRCAKPSTGRWTSSPAGPRRTYPRRRRSPPGRRSSCSSPLSRRPSPRSGACSGGSAPRRSAGCAVDEAGQATPQNAVGALWRCQRAVIVGDPQQLEPITTVPFRAEQAIREHYGVEEEWLTGRDLGTGPRRSPQPTSARRCRGPSGRSGSVRR